MDELERCVTCGEEIPEGDEWICGECLEGCFCVDCYAAHMRWEYGGVEDD